MNSLFLWSFENKKDIIFFSKYYTPKVEIKYFNGLIARKSFFDVPVKNKEETYKKVIELSNNNGYTTGNLLDYKYLSKHYKLIAIDLSKQVELENLDLKQQINSISKLQDDRATMFFIIEKRVFTKFCEYHIKWKHKRLKTCGMIEVIKNLNLLQSDMSEIVLNLKQKLLYQVFVIILMHLFQLREIYSKCRK